MTALVIASLETRNFDFEGVGTSRAEALDVLKQGLRAHARQYHIDADWFADDLESVEYRSIERGTAFRDRQEI